MLRDNSTLSEKTGLRLAALRELDQPSIVETHGGAGAIFERCYHNQPRGVVFERDQSKSELLAEQRPTWAVYRADCIAALSAGVGMLWQPNYFDVDPYGQCWPTIDAICAGLKHKAKRIVFVVNCGLRQKLRLRGGWRTETMAEATKHYGNQNLFRKYLFVCRDFMSCRASALGYRLTRWTGYYCGHNKDMTHFAAVWDKPAPSVHPAPSRAL